MPRVDKDTFIQEWLQAAEFNRKPEPDSKEWWRDVAQGLAIKAREAEQQASAAAQQRDQLREALTWVREIAESVRHGHVGGQQAGTCGWNMTVGTKREILRIIDAALAPPAAPTADTRRHDAE